LHSRFLTAHGRFAPNQSFDRIPQVIFGKVGVTQGRFNSLVAHENLHGAQRDARHHQPAGKGVAEIMPVEI
jgi:hypothetical protein